MTKPRILFVDQSGALGGAELYLLDVAHHFRATSKVVLFEDGPFRARLEEEGVAAEVLLSARDLLGVRKQGGFREALRVVPALLRTVRQLAQRARAYDLIYANSQKALVASALAGTWVRRPVVWNLHDLLTAEHFSAVNRRVAVALANGLTKRVIANSQASLDAFAAAGGDVSKGGIVYNGIDAARFQGAGEERNRLRRSLGVEGVPVVGVFSRLARWKGQHVLIEALSRLEDAHVLLVGEALFGEDDTYARRLRRQVEQGGLENRVHFLGFRDDVPALMQLCDVVAHTSVAPEPFGRVVVEAMLAETPVVASRAGGPLEIVDHERTGLLVQPGDAGALAVALRRLLENPVFASTLATSARKEARKRFSVETMTTQIEHELAEALT